MHFYFLALQLFTLKHLLCPFFRKIKRFNQVEKLFVVRQALVTCQLVQNFFQSKIFTSQDVQDLELKFDLIGFKQLDNLST